MVAVVDRRRRTNRPGAIAGRRRRAEARRPVKEDLNRGPGFRRAVDHQRVVRGDLIGRARAGIIGDAGNHRGRRRAGVGCECPPPCERWASVWAAEAIASSARGAFPIALARTAARTIPPWGAATSGWALTEASYTSRVRAGRARGRCPRCKGIAAGKVGEPVYDRRVLLDHERASRGAERKDVERRVENVVLAVGVESNCKLTHFTRHADGDAQTLEKGRQRRKDALR